MERVARCSCGSASICTSGEPVWQSVCHCNHCKKRTGSAFGIGAYFKKSAVIRIEGESRVYAFQTADGSAAIERYFCATCGTTLYWYSSTLPKLVGIAGGCFADDPLGEPSVTASTSKKLDWVAIPSTWRVWPES
jgi:hypothetical protein